MTLQVIVSTMNRSDFSMLSAMNIQSDAIVVNQAEQVQYETVQHNNHNILWMSMPERGVGLSRNTGFMRATADIILFADDDMRYIDGYEEKIIEAFEKNPGADMIIFDVNIMNDAKETANYRRIEKVHRLHWYNSMRYGACRIAVRREILLKNNICYSLLFGGGARYSSGEDSLFIKQCLDKGMCVLAHPLIIADVDSGNSSWFKGMTDKLFWDKGALLKACFPRICGLLYVYYAAKLCKYRKDKTFFDVVKMFIDGGNEFRCKE